MQTLATRCALVGPFHAASPRACTRRHPTPSCATRRTPLASACRRGPMAAAPHPRNLQRASRGGARRARARGRQRAAARRGAARTQAQGPGCEGANRRQMRQQLNRGAASQPAHVTLSITSPQRPLSRGVVEFSAAEGARGLCRSEREHGEAARARGERAPPPQGPRLGRDSGRPRAIALRCVRRRGETAWSGGMQTHRQRDRGRERRRTVRRAAAGREATGGARGPDRSQSAVET
jgi:hypothetical protein